MAVTEMVIPRWIRRSIQLRSTSFLALALLLTALIGCRAEPFQRPPLPVLVRPDPQAIRQQFPHKTPEEFTSDDTLILQFPFHDDLVMLGVLNVNRSDGTFELYALNQTGITYFHLSGIHGEFAIRDAIGPWMEHKDILLAIGRDIAHIYLNPAPSPSACIEIYPTNVCFTSQTAEGKLVYDFGMVPTVLLQKQAGGFFGASCGARYYDYEPGSGGKLFPRGITMDNYHFHYRLIIKNRDWSIGEMQ